MPKLQADGLEEVESPNANEQSSSEKDHGVKASQVLAGMIAYSPRPERHSGLGKYIFDGEEAPILPPWQIGNAGETERCARAWRGLLW